MRDRGEVERGEKGVRKLAWSDTNEVKQHAYNSRKISLILYDSITLFFNAGIPSSKL